MTQTPQASPSRLRKYISSSSSNLQKSKIILPSRYVQPIRPEKSGFHDILNQIQSQIRQQGEKQKSPSPKIKKSKDKSSLKLLRRDNSSSQFKSRPLKRQQNDIVNFNEIFLNPRQQSLKAIKKLSQQQNVKTIAKQYQKILKFERGEQNTAQENQKNQLIDMKQSYQQAFQFLQSQNSFGVFAKKIEKDFYDTQISLQVPNMNSTTAIISGSRFNESISLPSNYGNSKDLNLKQLLLRAKAGMNSDDIEKQAHLCFYLGEVYSERKSFRKSLKFFKRFLGLAKIMQDKIGMSVGANRVGICHYSCKQYEKSISFHMQNLKLSNNDSCFIGYYNIGLCYRKIKKTSQALQYFESALSWAQQRNEQQSQCIALGQIAVTYQEMELYQQAVDKFQQSLQMCNRIKKKHLRLNNLWNILRISSMLKIKSNQQLIKISQDAFECAKQLGQMHSLDILRCNVGILKGGQNFHSQVLTSNQINQIQQIQQ